MTTPRNDNATPSAKPLARDEVLGGLGGRTTKQAGALLLLLETRTVYLLADSRQAAQPYNPAPTRQMQAQAYLQTLAQGRERAVQPTIRDLERYARQWAELVPDNVTVRATTAHLLGEKYRFPQRMTPGVRRALGLDDAVVQQTYQQLYSRPLHTIYTAEIGLVDRLRWRWARLAGWLENLSPFWSAFALTLTETVGAGILALPIALAAVGPLAGVILLLVLGFVNLLTLAAVTEAITRHGPMRYGFTFFGQLVNDLLGRTGMVAFSLVLVVMNLLLISVYYIGVATALADATGVSALVWTALLFCVALYFLLRQSLNATIASALLIGLINLTLLLILAALAVPHVQVAHLRYVHLPGLNGAPFEPKLIELVFGIVLTAYLGHTVIGNIAKVVLHRDPSGRTLYWGNLTAMATAIVLYSLWVVAINGALAPNVLAGASGTILGPLAQLAGPAVHLFGGIFAVLGMGMASIHYALALFNQVREWLSVTGASAHTSTPRTPWQRRPAVRMGLGIVPTLLIFLLVEWLLWTNQASFAGLLAVGGALALPLVTGIFPVLLLIVSRRKGDYVPGVVWRWLGNPLVLGLIYLLFLASLLAHGLIIWTDLPRRTVALAASAGILLLTWIVLRRRTLIPRTVVEVRLTAGRGYFQVVSYGKPLAVPVTIQTLNRKERLTAASGEVMNPATVRSLGFALPAGLRGDLKLWLHQVTPKGTSLGFPARCLVHTATGVQVQTTTATAPELILPWDDTAHQLEVQLLTDRGASA